ncbi:MAG: disulfide oxidoreductase [Burkholderiales bacterium]
MNTADTPVRAGSDASAWTPIFSAWLVASVSTLGALFFSEVMRVPPCVLCWYQRIFMFPLVLILPIGMFPLDRNVARYALPMAAFGWLFAAFHVLLMSGVVPEDLKPCTQGVPCSEKVIEWFGFVTIPLMALVAFTLIIIFLVFAHLRSSR